MPLTKRKREFARYYAATGQGAESARSAGYSTTNAAQTAYMLLKDDEVQALINDHKNVKDEVENIDVAWVVKEAVDTYRAARDANQNAAALTALQLIAKHTGGFDGGEMHQQTHYSLVLAGMRPEDIRELAKLSLPGENNDQSRLRLGSGQAQEVRYTGGTAEGIPRAVEVEAVQDGEDS